MHHPTPEGLVMIVPQLFKIAERKAEVVAISRISENHMAIFDPFDHGKMPDARERIKIIHQNGIAVLQSILYIRDSSVFFFKHAGVECLCVQLLQT